MKRIYQSLTGILLSILTMNSYASDDYFQTQLGLAMVDTYNLGFVMTAGYGMQLPGLHKYLSMETELASPFISPSKNTTERRIFYTVGEYLVYSLPFSANANMRVRAGVNYVVTESPTNTSSFQLGIGFGLSYKLAERKLLLLDFTDINDISYIVAGVQLLY